MQLDPYLFFGGCCEEALRFYQQVLGGTYDVSRYAGSPAEEQAPPGWAQKIMHSTFKGDGFSFMASDNPYGVSNKSSVALSLATQDAEEAKSIFERLSDGGSVVMPFGPTFWGGHFGMLKDRFGQEWMVSGGHGG